MGDTPRLIVLGSGTSVPRADRASSCYLVEDGGGHALLVDLGPGALHRAAAAGWPLPRLHAVLLTHIHPDHCADLVALQFALRNPLLATRPAPVTVAGDAAVGLLVARLRNAWPGWLGVDGSLLRIVAVVPGPVELAPGPAFGGWRIEAFRVAHAASSLGYRLTLPGGFTLAFSGDATEGGDLLALGRDADLFVLEAAVPDERPVEGHLSPSRAGRVAAACRARHLLLTHFYPPVLEQPLEPLVRQSFEGRLTLAEDGLILPLPS
jgi:ribonuclease BN (tRNA processing enzyme)